VDQTSDLQTWTASEVGAFFDERAPRYERFDMHRWLAAQAVEAADIRTGAAVLDVATGTGLAARALLASTKRVSVVGLDISAGMLAVAKEKMAPTGRFPVICGDALRLPFCEGVFDHVLCVASIGYLTDTTAALREWVRVSRVGGRITITAFVEDGITSQQLIRKAAAKEGVHIEDSNKALGSCNAFRSFATRGGLTDISLKQVSHQEPLREPDSAWRNFLGSPLATTLRMRGASLLSKVYDSYAKSHEAMKEAGQSHTRTSLIMSGLVSRKPSLSCTVADSFSMD
jgi:ubiquinone/menaquinone biosynthesis C-methylase UbiE